MYNPIYMCAPHIYVAYYKITWKIDILLGIWKSGGFGVYVVLTIRLSYQPKYEAGDYF